MEALKRWRARADYAPPFEFYASLLETDGGRARLLERLGPEAADAIDEFLDLALGVRRSCAAVAPGFPGLAARSDIVIKRDMEQGRGEVRVMTVHGAKGLEAPIVFLPDTCTTRSGERPGGLLPLPDADAPAERARALLLARERHQPLGRRPGCAGGIQARETEERQRLLYVAMTRARDRLYVAGFEGVNGRSPGCWYDLIADALAGSLTAMKDAAGRTIQPLGGRAGGATPDAEAESVIGPEVLSPPDWARRPAPREPDLAVPLVPSRLAPLEIDAEGEPIDPPREKGRYAEPPSIAPAVLRDGQRFLRGTLTHALLQHLPGLDGADVGKCGRPLRSRARRRSVARRTRQHRGRDPGSAVATGLRAVVRPLEPGRGSDRGRD